MTRSSGGREREGERGQIMIMFTLVIVLLMALAAVVIDVSLLRTDGGKLQNALDGGALAAGQKLPANSTNVASITGTATSFSQKNYPGMALGGNPSIPDVKYACLIGIDSAGLPRITDMPAVCNVTTGSATAIPGTPLPANNAAWSCTTAVCWAPCDPVARPNEICNTIILYDNVTRQYSFGRAVGVNSGNTGVLSSAACSGVCGSLPLAPVDALVLLDRTGSMDDSNSVDNLRDGAKAVLQAFDPSLQRVALGFTGPSSLFRLTGGYYGNRSSSQPTNACTTPPHNVKAISLDPGAHLAGPTPTYLDATQVANNTAGDNKIVITRMAGINVGNFLLTSISLDDGNNVNVTPPAGGGWTLLERTDNGGNVGVATYWKFATFGDTGAGTWQWGLSNGTRASAIVVRYTGVDTADPIVDSSEDTDTDNAVTAPSVTTDDGNSALVGVFAADTRNTNAPFTTTFTMTGGSALTERGDIANGGATSGPSLAVATGVQATSANTGSRSANAANMSFFTRWSAQLIALHAVPGQADTYDVNDVNQWIPIGFTGMDNDTPAVAHHVPYVDANNNPIASTDIVQAIGCFDVSQVGTNLATPLQQALAYMQAHGRPGVKQGIIFETDGTPEHNNGQTGVGPLSNFTCDTSTAAANAVKAAGIELFMIGYGVTAADNGGSVPVCPDHTGRSVITQLASMATQISTSTRTTSCDANENTDGDHFFCTPAGGDLKNVLHAAAAALAGGTRLVQLYPTPIVSSVPSPRSSGSTITITGKYFTEAYAVTFGGVNAGSFTVNSDTSITVVVPPGTSGSTVDVQVSTPGGTSLITSSDKFRYN